MSDLVTLRPGLLPADGEVRMLSHARSDLIAHSQKPFNAEPPLERLRGALVTGQKDFYVRSHGNIPRLDETSHRLRVGGLVRTLLDLSVPDLRARFPVRTVTAVMQCAGNRRADMQQVKPTSGDPWAPGAIGNAQWTGVLLADVLRAAGACLLSSAHTRDQAAIRARSRQDHTAIEPRLSWH